MAECVAGFLLAGAERQQRLLVVATVPHWRAIEAQLVEAGLETSTLQGDGQLTVLDADEMLSLFVRGGEPDPSLFNESVAATVKQLAADAPNGLVIYGEMVEVLAQEGNYESAAKLEQLWNELSVECSFTLLCGYSSTHFAGPDAGSTLSRICCEHSSAVSRPTDALGHFLLSSQQKPRTRSRLSPL